MVNAILLWQFGPNLSSGIRWCLALAIIKPQRCLLWRFTCVCECECWSGPCMCDGSLLNSCYLCQLWHLKTWGLSFVTHQWCLQCLPQLCAVAWSEYHWWCQLLSGVVNFMAILLVAVSETVWFYQDMRDLVMIEILRYFIWYMFWICVNDLMKSEHWKSQT